MKKTIMAMLLATTLMFTACSDSAKTVVSGFEDGDAEETEETVAIEETTEETTIEETAEPTEETAAAPVHGSTIKFGAYEQDNDATNGKEQIEWLVLKNEGNKVLIMSKYVLDNRCMGKSGAEVTWETSTLREWLNDKFYKNAFSSKEQERIISSNVKAAKNPTFEVPTGNDTVDKVFILSFDEWSDYNYGIDYKCYGTQYAISKGLSVSELYDGWTEWWLRTPGNQKYTASYARYDRAVFGASVEGNLGVRPAMWVDLTDWTEDSRVEQEEAKPVDMNYVYSEYLKILEENREDILQAENNSTRFCRIKENSSKLKEHTPSINFYDINNDGIEEMILFKGGGAPLKLVIYGYDSNTDEVVELYTKQFLINHFFNPGWGEGFVLENGNLLIVSNEYIDISDEINEVVIEAKFVGNRYDIVKKWWYNCSTSNSSEVSATLNDETIDPGEYIAAYEEYKKQIALPLMPIPDRFVNKNFSFTEDTKVDRKDSVFSGDVFEKGHFYHYDEFVTFLKGKTQNSEN